MYSTGCYEQDSEGTWSVKQNEARIPWIPIDPSGPVDLRQYPRFKHAQVLDVTLQRGDVLYLPALWFHRVSQTASEDPQAPLAVAINVGSETLHSQDATQTDAAACTPILQVVVRSRLRFTRLEFGKPGPAVDAFSRWTRRTSLAGWLSCFRHSSWQISPFKPR